MLPPGLHSQYSSRRGVNVKLMKLHYLKTFLFSCAIGVSLQSYALDPRLSYDKISSENFDIIYDAKSYELAKIYLAEAERSHKILVDVFGISPDKTVVVLDNTYEVANGSAIGVPRPLINIYVNSPTPLASIDHFSYWPRDVFLHEYAHILNMEPARGIWKPFRFLFGSFVRPNMLLPRWYLEGLAVEMESRFNEFGRLKSTDYDAMIRALYLGSQWGVDNLSAINESSTPSWPEGQRPYFYGALVWHELIQSKSISIVKTFNEHYARRVPYFISEPMVKQFGKTYQVFLKEVYAKYGNLAQQQIQKISEQEITQGTPILTKNSVFNHSPEMSPDGEKLTFVSRNLDGDSVIYIMKRLGETWVPLSAINPSDDQLPLAFESKEIQKASWFPNSNKIIYDAEKTSNRTDHIFKLYVYDLDTKKSTNLKLDESLHLRAREPAVSPTGDAILFVNAEQGKTVLYTVDAEGKNPNLIYTPPDYDRVSRPAYLNSNEIIFSQKTKGVDRLHVLDLNTKKVIRILDIYAKYPVVTPKGVVFTSNKSGVENLYLASVDFKSIKPLTNSLTKVMNGTLDLKSNKIIFSELTSNGPQIKESSLEKEVKLLPTVEHPIAKDYKDPILEATPLDAQPKKYSALPYMFPQYWIPTAYGTADGTVTSITTSAMDPTGFHAYELTGTYDSRIEKFSGSFNYLWENSIGTTILTFKEYNNWYSAITQYTNHQQAKLQHAFYIPGLSNYWNARLGYGYKKSGLFENIGFGIEDINYYFNGPSAQFTFDNLYQGKYAISPVGKFAKIQYTNYLSNTTSTDYDETFVKLGYLHKKWLPDRHVLAFSMQGVDSNTHRSILLGTTSSEIPSTSILGSVMTSEGEDFIVRGYPSGNFIGYSMASGTLEYRFPLLERWKGPDSPIPYFLRRIHGALFAETLTLKGGYFDELNFKRANWGKFYSSAGLELSYDMTLFYHVPITFKLGGGYGFESDANGGLNVNLALTAPQAF